MTGWAYIYGADAIEEHWLGITVHDWSELCHFGADWRIFLVFLPLFKKGDIRKGRGEITKGKQSIFPLLSAIFLC